MLLRECHRINSTLMRKLGWIAALALVLAPSTAFAVPETIEVDLDGTTVQVDYDATGLAVSDIDVNTTENLLTISIDVTGSPGILEITFDRIFFDSVYDGTDEEFIIIAEGDEPRSEEITTSDESRTLRIELPTGTEELEIFGTSFGGSTDDSDAEREAEEQAAADLAEAEQLEAEQAAADLAEAERLEAEQAAADLAAAEAAQQEAADLAGAEEPELSDPCGPGTVLEDGECVLKEPAAKPVGSGKDLIFGAAAGFIIAIIVVLVLWAIRKSS